MDEKEKIVFLKEKIIEHISEIKDYMSDTKYRLYLTMLNNCNTFDDIREIADMDLQMNLVNYLLDINNKLKLSNTTIDELEAVANRNSRAAKIYVISSNKRKDELNTIDSDLEDEEVLDYVLDVMESTEENEPLDVSIDPIEETIDDIENSIDELDLSELEPEEEEELNDDDIIDFGLPDDYAGEVKKVEEEELFDSEQYKVTEEEQLEFEEDTEEYEDEPFISEEDTFEDNDTDEEDEPFLPESDSEYSDDLFEEDDSIEEDEPFLPESDDDLFEEDEDTDEEDEPFLPESDEDLFEEDEDTDEEDEPFLPESDNDLFEEDDSADEEDEPFLPESDDDLFEEDDAYDEDEALMPDSVNMSDIDADDIFGEDDIFSVDDDSTDIDFGIPSNKPVRKRNMNSKKIFITGKKKGEETQKMFNVLLKVTSIPFDKINESINS